MNTIKTIIESAFEQRQSLTPDNTPTDIHEAVQKTLNLINTGELRVAEKIDKEWTTHEWAKKAVLLSFKISENQTMPPTYFDKVPLKFEGWSQAEFEKSKIRAVPGAIVRSGCYIGQNTVLMPSFINIGAYVGNGTLVDTWATVGSCAQIGDHVHLSGGVGIGGVLEPLQATPTIIEDNCFIGARSEIVEGVIVERNSVIGMGVYIGKSTRIYHRESGEVTYGRIPEGSVVVPGNLPSQDGKYGLYCAIIVKQVDEKTRSKTSLNELLREVNLA
ncbi:MAG: 2,3,4,5-tetrahydropyridine-2,6-dicarboxylate N-succinyltransferase [Gammaproteobacteria bacterium]